MIESEKLQKETEKRLLKMLLSECVKRDFTTLCQDGVIRYTGMCGIIDDMETEKIINNVERRILKVLLFNNRPYGVRDAHWYDSTPEGNNNRIKFLETQISKL